MDASWTWAVRMGLIRRSIKDIFIQIGISSLKIKGIFADESSG
jgi:hypothetical protein